MERIKEKHTGREEILKGELCLDPDWHMPLGACASKPSAEYIFEHP
jgi:hypothetical protein